MIKMYSQNLRTKIRKKKGLVGGVKFDVKFQKRWKWFIWITIDEIEYSVYDYWEMFNTPLHKQMGVDYFPLIGNYQYGKDYEVWKPEYFNLDKSLEDRWLSILSNQAINESIYKQFEHI